MAHEALRLREAATGMWHTVGTHIRAGLPPAQIRPTADQSGPATLSFVLTRESDRPWPDLGAYEEVEYEVDGKVVWEGRIKETPSGTASGATTVTVQCVGWINHLDNDAYQLPYVIGDIGQLKDIRQMPNAPLGWAENRFAAHGQIGGATTQPGIAPTALTFGWAKGEAMTKGELIGVVLDLGPNYPLRLEAVSLEWFWTHTGFGGIAAGQMLLYVYAQGTIGWESTGKFFGNQKFITGYPMGYNSGTEQTSAAKLQASANSGFHRYLHIVVKCNESSPGGVPTLAEDIAWSLSHIEVFAKKEWMDHPPYGNGNTASNLRASDVVIEAVGLAAPKLTAAPASPTWAAEAATDGPMDWWSFGGLSAPEDEGAGLNNEKRNLADTVKPTYNQPSLLSDDVSTGAKFQGSSQYCSASKPVIPTSSGLMGVAVEAIVRPDAVGAAKVHAIFQQESAIELGLNSEGKPWFVLATSAGTANPVGPTILTAAKTYHLVGSYDVSTGTARIYVNGVEVASASVTAGATINGSASLALVGAATSGAPVQFFNGVIQKVLVYPTALTTNQVEQHYKAALAREYGTVQRTQFKLAAYSPTTSRTPRQHIDAVDAVHLWRKKVLSGKRLLYAPQASLVRLEAAPGIDFQDAAANSADLIYSKVIVEGQNAVGEQIRLTRTAAELFRNTARAGSPSSLQLLNPGGESAPAEPEWEPLTSGAKTILSQDATHVLSGTHSIKWGEKKEVFANWPSTAVFKVGHVYRLRLAIYSTAAAETATIFWGENGGGFLTGNSSIATMGDVTGAVLRQNAWTFLELIWSPNKETTKAGMTLEKAVAATTLWIDGIVVEEVQASAPERNGYHNTKVLQANSNIDLATAEALANAFLASTSVSPFRGQFVAAKVGDVHRLPGHEPVHPSELMLAGGELIRIPRINPDTGDLGRDGKIATITYDPDKEDAVIVIDDDRNNFQALMNRMAAVQGGIA
jgi:hypothetical protein